MQNSTNKTDSTNKRYKFNTAFLIINGSIETYLG